ncbi:MAG: hypothetical protein R3D03_07740 [Geminicoccaceae bacterium]
MDSAREGDEIGRIQVDDGIGPWRERSLCDEVAGDRPPAQNETAAIRADWTAWT